MKNKEMTKILVDASQKIDNWDPCTCPIEDLRKHLVEVECTEDFIKAMAGRADFLRGVLSARVLSEIMNFDNRKTINEFRL